MSADRRRDGGLFAAIDIGGTSVRATVARCTADTLEIVATARMPTPFTDSPQGIRFDAATAFARALMALHEHREDLRGVAVDSWSADYAIEREDGTIEPPISQRQARTSDVIPATEAIAPRRVVFHRAGVRLLPLHTIYQLAADRAAGRLDGARSILLIPDLFTHWLTGARTAEYTNASSTGLTTLATRDWDRDLLGQLELASELFPPMVHAGDDIGTALPEAGIGPAVVTAAASHDTASATVALPTSDEQPLYISCGSWALVGTTTAGPVLSEAAFEAGFTNEAGLDGTNRFLRVCAGLWPLSECLRTWGIPTNTSDPAFLALLHRAESIPASTHLFDPEDVSLMQSRDMPTRLVEAAGLPSPHGDPATIVRLILDSLAAGFARQIELLSTLIGKPLGDIHIVGGGSAIDVLCGLTANASGRTVWAGPSEATTVGNLMVQARSVGVIAGDAAHLRMLARQAFPPRRFDPGRPPVRTLAGAAGQPRRRSPTS